MLKEWIKGMPATKKLFPKLEKRRTWLMVKKDLERVGIPYKNEEGVADFHAAGRHTHITELLRNGASLPEAMKLARHSDIKQTMKYTHIGLNDQFQAVAKLPMVQIRCISSVSDGQSVATDDNSAVSINDITPCDNKRFDVACQDLAINDESGESGKLLGDCCNPL